MTSPGRGSSGARSEPALVIGLTNAGYASITGFAVLLANDRYGNGNWLLTTFGVTLLVVRGALGFVADRIPPRSGLNGAHAVLVIGLVTVVASQSLPVAIVGIVICAMGHSMPWPILVNREPLKLGLRRVAS